MTTPWTSRTLKLDKHWERIGCTEYRKSLRDTLVGLWQPGWKILEGGCGTGLNYHYLPEDMKAQYTGIDFTQECVDICRENFDRQEFWLGDLTDLDSPDEEFDIVFTSNVLQHIEDWESAARQLVRVSKRYVVNLERTHKKRVDEVVTLPKYARIPGVIHRRFNRDTIPKFYEEYGEVERKWAGDSTDGLKKALMIYVLEKNQ